MLAPRAATVLVALAAGAAGVHLPAQSPTPPEVRQIVTFDLQPGTLAAVVGLYEQRLLPVYEQLQPLLRFRAYREAESPESLDLVVVSSYQGMAGMDAANERLSQPRQDGLKVGALYQQIDRLAVAHHDQFVEMVERLSDAPADESRGEPDQLTVFEYLRLTPATHAFLEDLLELRVRPFERDQELYLWSETGRVIVGDGWDYLRIFGMPSLGAWHEYVRRTREADFQQALAPIVVSRKTLILRREPRLSIR